MNGTLAKSNTNQQNYNKTCFFVKHENKQNAQQSTNKSVTKQQKSANLIQQKTHQWNTSKIKQQSTKLETKQHQHQSKKQSKHNTNQKLKYVKHK